MGKKESFRNIMFIPEGYKKFDLTTGMVTGCLAIPPYVTIVPPYLEEMGIVNYIVILFSSISDNK